MRRLSLIVLIALSTLSVFAQREVYNINRDWQFTPGWEVQKGKYTVVNLPHTWNLDALSGKIDYYRGLSNYVKYIDVPKDWANKKVYLRFKGSNQTSVVYINGKNAGTHKGGYTAFTLDVTSLLRLGEKNSIWVRVTNALDLDIMPLLGDFNMYGGIYRDVELIITPKTHIDLENYGSYGVFVTPSNVSESKADVRVKANIVGDINSEAEVMFTIRDAANKAIDSIKRNIKIDMDGKTDAEVKFVVNDPTLWNGRKNPYLYKVEVRVKGIKRGEKPTFDNYAVNFGIRYYSVQDSQVSLNGNPLKIQGVCRHQDWAGIGNAISRVNMEKDIEMMLDMGVNAVRLAHYPQDEYFLNLCDKVGIIVWSEIPFVGPGGYRDKGFNDSEAFRVNGKQQLREMIRQHYNHPSIFFWGLFNELIQIGDDPVPYLKELNEIVKDEDQTRITTGASNQNGDLNFVTDIIAFNKYYGWYGGKPQEVDDWGASLKRTWPKLQVGISEYGAGGSIYHQIDSLVKTNPTSYYHPEQWQTHFHEQHWKVISEKPYFWGTFVWAMFDFGAAHRTEGQIPGVNDKGLVTFDRTTPKDSYYFYKANWNKDDPFVYIAERRLVTRTSTNQTIKVYSNQPDVELLIDGVVQAKKSSTGNGIFLWENIKLSEGEHVVEAFAADCKADMASFTIVKPQPSITPKE